MFLSLLQPVNGVSTASPERPEAVVLYMKTDLKPVLDLTVFGVLKAGRNGPDQIDVTLYLKRYPE